MSSALPARNVSRAGTAATPKESDASTLSPSTNKISALTLLTSPLPSKCTLSLGGCAPYVKAL